jgi:hypothetical protein
MPRAHRRQVPKGARKRSPRSPGSHIGNPDTVEAMQLQSIARRYARCDRQQRPIHCHTQGKLMYDSEEIAKSTGQALQRIKGETYYAYPCPNSTHFHLTTHGHGKAVAS